MRLPASRPAAVRGPSLPGLINTPSLTRSAGDPSVRVEGGRNPGVYRGLRGHTPARAAMRTIFPSCRFPSIAKRVAAETPVRELNFDLKRLQAARVTQGPRASAHPGRTSRSAVRSLGGTRPGVRSRSHAPVSSASEGWPSEPIRCGSGPSLHRHDRSGSQNRGGRAGGLRCPALPSGAGREVWAFRTSRRRRVRYETDTGRFGCHPRVSGSTQTPSTRPSCAATRDTIWR